MEKQLHIGCDVDEVVTDFIGSFAAEANKVLGLNLDLPDWDCWDCSQALGITKEQEKLVWRSVLASSDFNLKLRECAFSPGFTQYLNRLYVERKANVTFITARQEHVGGEPVQRQTAQWLADHGFPNPCVLVTFNKGPVAKALGLDAFIDDKFQNCLEVKEATPDAQVFMPVRAYNKIYVSSCIEHGIRPVSDAYEALELLGIR